MSGSRACLVALTVLSLVASGCGGSSPPPVASLTKPPGGAAKSPSSSAQVQRDALSYARCMRRNGVPGFPDPQAGGGFQLQLGSGVNPSSPAFRGAQEKCQKILPPGPGAPGTATHPSSQWLAHMVKVARCMRRHGISDFPDPRTSVPTNPFGAGGAGVISDIEGAILIFPSTIDMQSPAFTQAATSCGFPLHNH